ncbi:DUF6783 domain-containing protein [Blautia sp.]
MCVTICGIFCPDEGAVVFHNIHSTASNRDI